MILIRNTKFNMADIKTLTRCSVHYPGWGEETTTLPINTAYKVHYSPLEYHNFCVINFGVILVGNT